MSRCHVCTEVSNTTAMYKSHVRVYLIYVWMWRLQNRALINIILFKSPSCFLPHCRYLDTVHSIRRTNIQCKTVDKGYMNYSQAHNSIARRVKGWNPIVSSQILANVYSILVARKRHFNQIFRIDIYIYSHSEPFVLFIATENVVVNHRSQLSVCVASLLVPGLPHKKWNNILSQNV